MKKRFFPNKLIQVLGLLLAALLLATPFFFFIDMNSLAANKLYPTIFFVIFCLLFISISYLLNYKRKQKMEWSFKIINLRVLYLLLLLLLVFQIGINKPINSFLNQILHYNPALSNPFAKPLFIIGATLLAPILEEIIFRGIILKGLLTRYTPKYAILFSSIIFGLIHGKPLQIWGAVVLGLILGFVYYKTKSIGTTILLHSFANLIVVTENYFIYKYVNLEYLNSINIFLFILSTSLILILLKPLLLKLKTEL
jgi:membrane protease YdiL (CAAX protease family)